MLNRIRCTKCSKRHNEGNRRRRLLQKQQSMQTSRNDVSKSAEKSDIGQNVIPPAAIVETAKTVKTPEKVKIPETVNMVEGVESLDTREKKSAECESSKTKKLLVQISKNVSGRVSTALKNQIHRHETAEQLLGCTLLEYKSFLEKQFEPGMTWDNWGRWNVDHVVPVSSVNLCDPLTRVKIFHYSNTRPMWTDKNLKKSSFCDHSINTTVEFLTGNDRVSGKNCAFQKTDQNKRETKNVRFNDSPVSVMIQSCNGLERLAAHYQTC